MKKLFSKPRFLLKLLIVPLFFLLSSSNSVAYSGGRDYITITECSSTVYVGEGISLEFIIHSYYDDFSCTFTSSDPKIIKVNSDQSIVAVGVGTADIIIKTSHAEKRVPITVKEVMAEHLNLYMYSHEVQVGKTAEISTSVSPSNTTNRNVYFSSSDNSIATVTSKGVVKGIAPGTVTITGTTSNHITKTLEIHVFEVVPKEIVCEDAISLTVGDSCAFPVKILPLNANNPEYSLAYDDEFLQCSDSKLHAMREGETTLHIETWNGIEKDVSVMIDRIPVQGINIQDSTKYIFSNIIDKSAEILLVPEIVPDNATYQDVVWHSSDNDIVSVADDKFVVHATGKVTLSCSTEEGVVNGLEFVVVDVKIILLCIALSVAGIGIVAAVAVKERKSDIPL